MEKIITGVVITIILLGIGYLLGSMGCMEITTEHLDYTINKMISDVMSGNFSNVAREAFVAECKQIPKELICE